MTRITKWRNTCPKRVLANQILAMEADSLFVLRQNGPLAFLIQELTRMKPFEVRLGDPHRCTCKWYKVTADLCLHICWIILKKFRICSQDALSFQRGMSCQELKDIISGKRRQCTQTDNIIKEQTLTIKQSNVKPVRKRQQKGEDMCPICLEAYSPNKAVMYCKYSCGNAVHARCIGMLTRHQESYTSPDAAGHSSLVMLQCPLCRGDFNTTAAIKLELRRQVVKRQMIPDPIEAHDVCCRFCSTKPITGNLYRCLACEQVVLCSLCVSSEGFLTYHKVHDIAIRQKSGGPWRRLGKVEEHLKTFNRNGNSLRDPPPKMKKNLLEFSKGFSFNCRQSNCISKLVPITPFCQAPSNAFHKPADIPIMTRLQADNVDESHKIIVNNQPNTSTTGQFFSKESTPHELKKQKRNHCNVVDPSLEVRVSRMHLGQRSKEQTEKLPRNSLVCTINSRNCRNLISKHKTKKCKPASSTKQQQNERSLSLQVNPLMTILMSPHLKQIIDHEKKESERTNFCERSLKNANVKSLEFPEDEVATAKVHRPTSLIRSSQSAHRAFDRSRSSITESHFSNKIL